MDDLERFSAIEEIKQLKARYFRYMDTKKFEELRTVFAEDAVFDVSDGMRDPVLGTPPGAIDLPRVNGLDNIIAGIDEVLRGAQSVHHGHMPEIEMTSDSTAKGLWPMEDIVLTDDFELRGYGHYHETYEKIDGSWRIKTLKLSRLRVIVEEFED